jgi:dipicolinate synthase subunit A
MEAKAFGYRSVDFTELSSVIGEAEFIFNTVPSKILTREVLRCVNTSSIIIDIASIPGGMDKEAVKEFGLHAEHCLSLPGIYAPKSSAVYLKDIVVCKKNRKG